MTHSSEAKQQKKASKSTPERAKDFENIKKNKDTDKLLNMMDRAQKAQPETNRVFQPYSFKELRDRPPKEWVVEDLIGLRDIGVIYGPSGLGKTFVVIDLIVSACMGKSFANFFKIKKSLKVAYFAGEGVSGLPERFKAAVNHHEIDDLANFTFYDLTPQLFAKDSSETMLNFLKEHKLNEEKPFDIIFIDTLHSATVGANENDGKDTGVILSMCKEAMKELKCSVVLVHHTNKNATSERGHSSLRGACDFMIEVCASSGRSHIKCAKLKDGKAWQPIGFDLCDTEDYKSAHVEWKEPAYIKSDNQPVQETDKQNLISQMELHEGTRFEAKDLAKLIDKDVGQTRRVLKELVKEGRCEVELKDPKKEAHNTNPAVYYISPY